MRPHRTNHIGDRTNMSQVLLAAFIVSLSSAQRCRQWNCPRNCRSGKSLPQTM